MSLPAGQAEKLNASIFESHFTSFLHTSFADEFENGDYSYSHVVVNSTLIKFALSRRERRKLEESPGDLVVERPVSAAVDGSIFFKTSSIPSQDMILSFLKKWLGNEERIYVQRTNSTYGDSLKSAQFAEFSSVVSFRASISDDDSSLDAPTYNGDISASAGVSEDDSDADKPGKIVGVSLALICACAVVAGVIFNTRRRKIDGAEEKGEVEQSHEQEEAAEIGHASSNQHNSNYSISVTNETDSEDNPDEIELRLEPCENSMFVRCN